MFIFGYWKEVNVSLYMIEEEETVLQEYARCMCLYEVSVRERV